MYNPLHCHSYMSLLDGISSTKAMAKRCKELEINTCALTDHGSLAGTVEFYQSMTKAKIKPILGIEQYVCREKPELKTERVLEHCLLLAKNLNGWKDLLQLTGLANTPANFYYHPRLDIESMTPFLQRGNLILIAGHLGSIFTPCIFQNGQIQSNYMDCCISLAQKLSDICGKDNFFIEIQMMDSDNNQAAKKMGEIMREVSQKTGIKKVATPDAHYCTKEDAEDQRVVLCTKLKTTMDNIYSKIAQGDDPSLSTFFTSNNYHIPSYEEMQRVHTEDELKNTLLIGEMCENYNITRKPKLPQYKTPNGESSDDYLRKLCREGWKSKENEIEEHMKETGLTKKDYGDRFNMEFRVLSEAKLIDYFLIVKDIIAFSLVSDKLVGCGRGSAAGSLILYLLDVTKIDPLRYNLLFSRFYSTARNVPSTVSFNELPFGKFESS